MPFSPSNQYPMQPPTAGQLTRQPIPIQTLKLESIMLCRVQLRQFDGVSGAR